MIPDGNFQITFTYIWGSKDQNEMKIYTYEFLIILFQWGNKAKNYVSIYDVQIHNQCSKISF